MLKPIGPICNLACTYCYYLAKEQLLFGAGEQWRMSDARLESFTRQYIEAHRHAPEIGFAWQGGEPTLMGLDFFRRALELQRRYAPADVPVTNSIQTNGTLLDDEWGEFFADHHFLVGLSMDGPRDLHDAYRVDRRGAGTFDRVMAGLKILHKHNVDFNALVVVNRKNARRPLDVYRFLRDEAGARFIQFIPCVERADHRQVAPQHWPPDSLPKLGAPAARPGSTGSVVTPWSADPDDFGEFLCRVFDEWLVRDVGGIFVQTFDVALGQWMGRPAALCVWSPTCGTACAMEHDGGVYACDHYVYPEFRLGHIDEAPLVEMVESERQQQFGRDKSDKLPQYCRECEVRFACNGECPKNRFIRTPTGEPGLNYLCSGLRRFFRHIDPWMRLMAAEVGAGRPAANVMRLAAARERSGRYSGVGRNDPCPCGSGKKFKKCCMGKKESGLRGQGSGVSGQQTEPRTPNPEP